MNTETMKHALRERLDRATSLLATAEGAVGRLPKGAQTEIADRLRQARVVANALDRDIEEMEDPAKGTDEETALELARVLDGKVNLLQEEAEFLTMGSPSTLEKAGDAAMDALDKAARKTRALVDEARHRLHSDGDK